MWMSYVYVYIRKIYVQIYHGNFKSDKCIMIHVNWRYEQFLQVHRDMTFYSTYQFTGHGLTEHGTYLKYIVHRSFKLVGWYPLAT